MFKNSLYHTCKSVASLIVIILLFSSNTIQAQRNGDYLGAITSLYSPIDKSQVPTGFLYEYGDSHIKEGKLNGVRTDSNYVIESVWRLGYSSVYSSRIFGTNPLPTLIQIQNQIKNYNSDDLIALPTFYLQYANVRADAISANLLTYNYQNKKVYDVAGRTQSPYVVRSSFASVTSKGFCKSGKANFVFRNDMFYSNTGKTISKIEVDFDNGQGLQILQANIPIEIIYNTTGNKRIKYKLTFQDNSIQESHSEFWVIKAYTPTDVVYRYTNNATDNPPFFLVNETPTCAGGKGYILYSQNNMNLPASQRLIRKPLIVVEGYDATSVAPDAWGDNYSWRTFVRDINATSINGQLQNFNDLLSETGQYDLIFIDYDDGVADIRRNAEMVRRMIIQVNNNKVPLVAGQPKEKNVVIGLSMGGLVGRYALAQMVRAGENPDTRLLITHDSPHRGANIPLGMQAIFRMIDDNDDDLNGIKDNVGRNIIDQRRAIFDAPATRQLLLVRATNPNGGIEYNNFLETEYRQMVTGFTMPYEFIGTSMGSECGLKSLDFSQVMIEGSGTGWGVSYFTLLGIWGDGSMELDVRTLPASGSARVAHLRLTKWVRFLGISIDNVDLYNKSYFSPAGLLPFDSAPGGNYKVKDKLYAVTNPYYDQWWSGLTAVQNNVSSQHYPARNYCFVPTASALDIPLQPNTLFQAMNSGYSGIIPTTMSKFITQEPIIFNGVTYPNQFHADPLPTRTARWIFKQMEASYNVSSADLICNRPCPPSGLPDITMNNNLMCVGEERVLTSNTNWTNISIVTSPNLVYNARPNRSITAVGKGYAWATIQYTFPDCPNPVTLKTIYLWIGEPYVPNAIMPISFGSDYIADNYTPNGLLKVCGGTEYKFEVNFDALPNGASAGVTEFEWQIENGTILSQVDNVADNPIFVAPAGYLEELSSEPNFKARTSIVTIKTIWAVAASGVLRVRLRNACGVSGWQEIAFAINVDNCYSGGTPVGPGGGFWDIIEPVAFENPIGSGRLKMRLNSIPDVDYNNLDPKTLAGFTYQIKLYNNQGDEKLIWEGDTVESDADVSFLQQGLYSAKVIFGNGQCIKNIHLIKQ